MNAEQFLARVVGPGNYLCIAWKDPARKQGGMIHRFFPRTDVHGAAGLMKWAASKGNDVWFAPAGFETAHAETDKQGRTIYKGERTQDNASMLRCFWIDIDVRRDGDKKGANVYETRQDALAWVTQFTAALELPPPNLLVDSGYGWHVYWILEDPMTKAEWQPYADAMRNAIQRHGFRCEAGLTSDAARLLRPPETLNFKAGMPGVPVIAHPSRRGDIPNA